MGTGGSRYGAGRPGWRRKCEQSLPLDIRKLHRHGRLAPVQSFGWQWTRDDEPCGNITITTCEHRLELRYTWTPTRGSPQHKCYDVPLERARCRFGGWRIWFRCPWCNRRCAVLYGLSGDGYFACRLCLKLAYASEAEDKSGRLWRKQSKLEAKLREDGGRSKGMRARTYERYLARIDAVEEERDREFFLSASRFFGGDRAKFRKLLGPGR
jgi:hypothetical protein